MANLKGFSKSEALYYIADGWAKSDPAQAARWFNANTSGELLEDAMGQILEAWGRQDPHEAFAWIDHLDEFIQASAMEGLAAAAWVSELQNREAREAAEMKIAHAWSERDPGAAMDWAFDNLDDSNHARQVAKEIMLA
jgi:hypothetical protein